MDFQTLLQSLADDPIAKLMPLGVFVIGLGLGLTLRRGDRGKSSVVNTPEIPAVDLEVRRRADAQMRRDHGIVAKLAMSLPNVVRELSRGDIKPDQIPHLIFNLAESIFSPTQMLFYVAVRPRGSEEGELRVVAHRGLSRLPKELVRIPIGHGKLGWIADRGLDMLAHEWRSLVQTDGVSVENNHPDLLADIAGPLLHQRGGDDNVLGVLCLGNPATRPKNEKLMFQLVTSIATLALVNSRSVKLLREQANTDGLTGLLNKRFFMNELVSMILDSDSAEARRFSLFIFDIDHFKTYNDTNGHPAGDDLLRRLSHLLKTTSRPGDLCCRYGGEEFIVAMPETSAEEALKVAEGIRRSIESQDFPHQEKQPNGNLTISGGVASFPKHGSSSEELVSHADEALYQSKKGGRNRVTLYRSLDLAAEEAERHEHEIGAPIAPIAR